MAFLSKQIYLPVIVIVLLILLNLSLSFAQSSGSCASEVHEDHGPSHAHRHCHHEIGHHRHDDHQQQHDREMVWMKKLPEELAEEENLKLLGFGSDHHDHEHQDYSDLGLTVTGFGQGKPSKAIVDSLAVFGRSTTTGAGEDKPNVDAANGSTFSVKSTVEKEPVQSPSTLVFGYLNLFSDGVIGDFGILVRYGFSVSTALFFNFLSALVALVGTALVSTFL